MAETSRLAAVLRLKENQEYRVKGGDGTIYRIHSGIREYKSHDYGWLWCSNEASLTDIIMDPSLIVPVRELHFTDEEKTVLRWLHNLGVEQIRKHIVGNTHQFFIKKDHCEQSVTALSNAFPTLDYDVIDLDEIFKEDING